MTETFAGAVRRATCEPCELRGVPDQVWTARLADGVTPFGLMMEIDGATEAMTETARAIAMAVSPDEDYQDTPLPETDEAAYDPALEPTAADLRGTAEAYGDRPTDVDEVANAASRGLHDTVRFSPDAQSGGDDPISDAFRGCAARICANECRVNFRQ